MTIRVGIVGTGGLVHFTGAPENLHGSRRFRDRRGVRHYQK